MGDDKGNQPSLADLMAKLEAIQADIDGLKAKSSSAATPAAATATPGTWIDP
jgi:hypothetical protein